MVRLNDSSPVDSRLFPEQFEWDTLRRSNHNFYEEKISQSIDGLQKMFMSHPLVRSLFPSFGQNSLVKLEINSKMQQLGQFTGKEIEEYRKINPSIQKRISRVFGTPFPLLGFGVGLLISYRGFSQRINLFQLIAFTFLPAIVETFYHKWNTKNKLETLQFLNWAIEYRTAKVNLERFQGKFKTHLMEEFVNLYKEKTVAKAYKDYLQDLNSINLKEK